MMAQESRLRVRRAVATDESTLFGWRNDPWMVQQGLSRRTVTAEEHHRWFGETLQYSVRELFLIEVEQVPAGMIRYDVQSPAQAEISIYLLPPYLAQGHGQDAFRATAPEILERRGLKRLLARVRTDNPRSLRFFQKLGFQTARTETDFWELVLEPPVTPDSHLSEALRHNGHNPDRARIAAYFDHLVDLHGHSPLGLDTSSEQALRVRYEALAEIADLRGLRVLEVGCGFGDLGAFLVERWGDSVDYTGVDISARMVEEGRIAHPSLRLLHGDLLDLAAEPQFDVVLAQGIFYLLGEHAEPRFFEMIAKMYSLARIAVGFCTISNWAETQHPGEFYADPLRTLEFCRSLTPALSLRHEYLPNDFRIFLYRAGRWRQGTKA